MTGHLFVCKADIAKLACDAWLYPIGKELGPNQLFQSEHLTDLGVTNGSFSGYFCSDQDVANEATATPRSSHEPLEYPMPILTVCDLTAANRVAQYLQAVDRFVDTFLADTRRYLSYRIRPLLAVPLVDAAWDTQKRMLADVITQLLVHCHSKTMTEDIDIVLVTHNPVHYSVIQMERRRLDRELDFWPMLSDDQKLSANQIADYSKNGKLVLFLGAGVSAGAGLPSWGQLLQRITEIAGFSEQQRAALQRFNFLDQAEILKKELAKRNLDMNREIVSMLASKKLYSLAHALISDWPIAETVTQNYDDMFEMACRDSEQPLSVIPYTYEASTTKWLLKMHGCVTRPEDIVLSRNDYLDYDYSRSALSGIVQALLVTKHMLFLGFSLTDDHFIQLIFGVHKAVEGMMEDGGVHKFGTVLTPVRSPMQEELWEQG